MLRRVVLPADDDPGDQLSPPRLGVRAGGGLAEIVMRNGQKPLRALPMGREVTHIQPGHGFRRNAFALHFVDQPGKTVGQRVKRRARSEIRRGIQ